MRVIAGSLGGRVFDAPSGHATHPMGDKIRGALFSILGDIEGLSILDAFAGSGALGFEAISLGADSVIAIERDLSAQKVIERNKQSLGVGDQFKLIKASATTWLQANPGAMFDIILLDPPYDQLQHSLLTKLAERVVTDGLLVLSWPARTDAPEFSELTKLKERRYGDAQLIFYQRLAS